MERAARSLAKLKLDSSISSEELVRAAWPAAVGPRIAAHTFAKALVRGSLVVEVDDLVWQKQLFALRFLILRNLNKAIGDGIVNDLDFRTAAVRRPPKVAESLRPKSLDEADGIADPVLRRVYKQARKKASA
jgi:predicted nucleic acid-binding Zn ribbon protein